MNVNKPNNARLNRIKTICRSLKIMLLLYLGGLVVFLPGRFWFIHQTLDGWRVFNDDYSTFAEIPWYAKSLALLCVGIFLAVVFTVYQLMNLYERGVIFSEGNVRLLRRIGWLAASYGALGPLSGTLIFAWHQNLMGTKFGNMLTALSFDLFGVLSSPWVIGGLFVIMISHIMGEGCKLQEEQELTV